jgi:hypothetical protein
MSEQGRQANRSGNYAEQMIAAALREHGCRFKRQEVIGFGIYGTELRVDFLVTNLVNFSKGLVIESKWQDEAGSVDEKFPYLVENIKHSRVPTVVVLHRNGYRAGARRWLRLQCDNEHLLAVYDLGEFMSWLIRSVSVVPEPMLL